MESYECDKAATDQTTKEENGINYHINDMHVTVFDVSAWTYQQPKTPAKIQVTFSNCTYSTQQIQFTWYSCSV